MATSGDIQVKPDHVIIWLDKNMCVPENNRSSKAVLDINANLDRPLSPEDSPDIDKIIRRMNSDLNDEKYDDLIKSPLRMFTDKTECIKCIKDSIEAKKQPFLITSGQMGALIVPEIYERLRGFIYIFCAQRDVHEAWTGPYENGIEIYDDEKGVFAKVLSDIGVYYLSKAQNESNQKHAIQYLHWARRLFNSATKIDYNPRKDYLQCVRDELDKQQVPPSDGYDSDCQMAKDADDE